MKYLIALIIIGTAISQHVVFEFSNDSTIEDWIIVDDRVMGGKSIGHFALTPNGHGLFEGNISLENYGGFSSVRYRFNKLKTSENSKIILTIKGDGKRYQFRIKRDAQDDYSYITYIETSGEWEVIEIPIREMFPSFRGRKLDLPNFNDGYIEEIGFL
jgi:hypothetical protein